MSFEPTARRPLVVHLRSTRVVRSLRHYGNLVYVSHRMHYAIIYIDEEQLDSTIEKIKKLRTVGKVVKSAWPELDPELKQLRQEMAVQQNEEDDVK